MVAKWHFSGLLFDERLKVVGFLSLYSQPTRRGMGRGVDARGASVALRHSSTEESQCLGIVLLLLLLFASLLPSELVTLAPLSGNAAPGGGRATRAGSLFCDRYVAETVHFCPHPLVCNFSSTMC